MGRRPTWKDQKGSGHEGVERPDGQGPDMHPVPNCPHKKAAKERRR